MNLLASADQPTLEDFGHDVWWIVLALFMSYLLVQFRIAKRWKDSWPPDCDVFILCGNAIPERGIAVANRFLYHSKQITGCESDSARFAVRSSLLSSAVFVIAKSMNGAAHLAGAQEIGSVFEGCFDFGFLGIR